MHSVGIDLVEIQRIEKSFNNPRFLERVYGQKEITELQSRGTQSYAAAFAAKEAFSKALGTGVRGFSLCEVQLLHDELGAPFLELTGKAQKIANSKGLEFSVSVTHTKNYAAAVVLAMQDC